MPYALFSKIRDDTSWEKLIEVIQLQKRRHCKTIPYNPIVELQLAPNDFDELTSTIITPKSFYLKYTSQSTANSSGVWNCIIIKCDTDSRKIILYTAGRTFPLYAAADFE